MYKKILVVLLALCFTFLIGCDDEAEREKRLNMATDFLERYYGVDQEERDTYSQALENDSLDAYVEDLADTYRDIVAADEVRDLRVSRYLWSLTDQAYQTQSLYEVTDVDYEVAIEEKNVFVYNFVLSLRVEGEESANETLRGQIKLKPTKKSYTIINVELEALN